MGTFSAQNKTSPRKRKKTQEKEKNVRQIRLQQGAQGAALPPLPDQRPQQRHPILPDPRLPDHEATQPAHPDPDPRSDEHPAPSLCPLRVWKGEDGWSARIGRQGDRGQGIRSRPGFTIAVVRLEDYDSYTPSI